MRPRTSWPSPEQTLLLSAALRRDASACRAWEAWSSRVDLHDLDQGAQRLVPLLVRNLRSLGVEHESLRHLRGVHRYWWSRNQLQLRCLDQVLALLAGTGVRAMALKGAPLALFYYEDVGLRPLWDVDILVPLDAAAGAYHCLRHAGWQPDGWSDLVEPDGRPATWRHSGANLVDDGGRQCDLHWHMLHDCLWDGADNVFWEHAESRARGGGHLLVPSPTDLLLHVCVHGAAYNPVPTLRWVADAVTILEVAGERIDWDRLTGLARDRLLVLPVREALDFLRRTLDVELPLEQLSGLCRARTTFMERREYAGRLRDPDYRYTIAGRWCELSRQHRHLGLLGRIARLPGFLRRIWSVERSRQLPGKLLLEALPAYLRRRANRAAPVDPGQKRAITGRT